MRDRHRHEVCPQCNRADVFFLRLVKLGHRHDTVVIGHIGKASAAVAALDFRTDEERTAGSEDVFIMVASAAVVVAEMGGTLFAEHTDQLIGHGIEAVCSRTENRFAPFDVDDLLLTGGVHLQNKVGHT